MAVWSPWAALAESEIDLVILPRAHHLPTPGAYLPDRNTVVMSSGLSSAMQRSVLTEELAHAELGHRPHADPMETARMELRARRLAAQRLVPLDLLAQALRGCTHWHEVAERLDVDEQLLRLRVHELDAQDRTDLARGVFG